MVAFRLCICCAWSSADSRETLVDAMQVLAEQGPFAPVLRYAMLSVHDSKLRMQTRRQRMSISIAKRSTKRRQRRRRTADRSRARSQTLSEARACDNFASPGTTLGLVAFPLIPKRLGTVFDTPGASLCIGNTIEYALHLGVLNKHQLSSQLTLRCSRAFSSHCCCAPLTGDA